MKALESRLERNPVIAAVRAAETVEAAAKASPEVVFLLCGDILNVEKLVRRLKEAGKLVLVHMDLLGGIGRDHQAVEYLAQAVQPDGIISTRSQLIRAAKERGLLTVQRFFLLDSQSVTMAAETAASVRPDMVEVMPGICPRVIRRLSSAEGRRLPVIAGGMIEEKEDIVEALSAGASGVSTSRTELWEL